MLFTIFNYVVGSFVIFNFASGIIESMPRNNNRLLLAFQQQQKINFC